MKKTWKHINLEQRKLISSGIAHNDKLIEIAERLRINPWSISKGINLDSEEFKKLDSIIKRGVDKNKSIYQIKIENNDIIDKLITTLYRYVNKDYLSTKRIDLPYAVKLKKRKHNKKYDYSNNNIDKNNHTYLNYLAYIKT